MTDTKPWYMSKTIWASLAAIIGALANFFGLSLSESAQDLLADGMLQIAIALAGLVALYGRLVADSKIEPTQ